MMLTGFRGGNPVSVTVGKSAAKPSPQPIDLEFMVNLQKKLNCSQKKLLMLIRKLKTKGTKFDEHIREDMDKLSHSLDSFYTVEKLEFVEMKKKTAKETDVELDLVYLKDPAAFIDHVV